jgi:hypothetical protein
MVNQSLIVCPRQLSDSQTGARDQTTADPAKIESERSSNRYGIVPLLSTPVRSAALAVGRAEL